jgi:hypothetical protein
MAAFAIGLLVAIFLVSRGCQTQGIDLTQDEAIAIAVEQVDFEPDRTIVRFVRRGVGFRPHWAVSLVREGESGEPSSATVVLIDAADGDVVSVTRE